MSEKMVVVSIPCAVCKKEADNEVNPHAILLNEDGDFACSETCRDRYYKGFAY